MIETNLDLITKEMVEGILQRVAPQQVESFKLISDETWREYLICLNSYFSGSYSSNGWYSTTYSWLLKFGASVELVHVLAVIRDDIGNEISDCNAVRSDASA